MNLIPGDPEDVSSVLNSLVSPASFGLAMFFLGFFFIESAESAVVAASYCMMSYDGRNECAIYSFILLCIGGKGFCKASSRDAWTCKKYRKKAEMKTRKKIILCTVVC